MNFQILMNAKWEFIRVIKSLDCVQTLTAPISVNAKMASKEMGLIVKVS